ncbi:permease DsdX [Escherichia coli]|nr:permease DsdX [Escherichia coli]
MAVHCVVPPHPAALYVANKLGADIGSVIVYGLLVGLMASLIGGPLFLKFLGQRLPFKPVPTEFADLKVRDEKTLPSLGATLFTILLPIALMLVKTIAELNMARESGLYILVEFIWQPYHCHVYRRVCRLLCVGYTPAYEHGDDAHTYGKWLRFYC